MTLLNQKTSNVSHVLKSRLNDLFIWQHWWTTILNWSNWEKSKQTCNYKSKQILYMFKHNLLIHKRILSSNQLNLSHRQSYQIKRWFKFDFKYLFLIHKRATKEDHKLKSKSSDIWLSEKGDLSLACADYPLHRKVAFFWRCTYKKLSLKYLWMNLMLVPISIQDQD